ncbi:MAG: hypothetical protein HOL48_08520 [Porticoccaceae bacterium]|jgi:hypothetical protein|nr:hypothetical protein [Porticoccaceae bacterium]
MRRFWCDCGHPLFFESTQCTNCGEEVGYDPQTAEMVTLKSGSRIGSLFGGGGDYQYCQNGIEHKVCNWLVRAEKAGSLCRGCSFNRTIPNLSRAENIKRWRRFEQAKKRLFYSLMALSLPLKNGWEDRESGLLFDFLEDKRSNPVLLESFVSTGYLSGVITINALEADDIAREATKHKMNESYRTMLGHLRHESGHYYYSFLGQFADLKEEFQQLFGDPEQDYQKALDRYYAKGPVKDWSKQYISNYASSHPLEDWAECWSHFQHMTDTLETAGAYQMVQDPAHPEDFRSLANQWRSFAVALNELNRSIGLADAYPFVITAQIERKLAFVGKVVSRVAQGLPAEVTY